MPGLFIRLPISPPFNLEAAGVLSTGSSISLSIAMPSESESEVESESDPNILTLLTELESVGLSFDKAHNPLDELLGESSTVLPRLFLCGICMPLRVMGEASGEASASVE
jgi:hypothetical protein